MESKNVVGKTKDAGWQMGVRKTINREFEEVWDFMFSKKGLRIWLGIVELSELEVNKEILLDNGISGKITVFKSFSHLRMKWKKTEWENTSRLQLRVIRSKNKTVISFAHEMLKNQKQREEMIRHWKEVVHNVSIELE